MASASIRAWMAAASARPRARIASASAWPLSRVAAACASAWTFIAAASADPLGAAASAERTCWASASACRIATSRPAMARVVCLYASASAGRRTSTWSCCSFCSRLELGDLGLLLDDGLAGRRLGERALLGRVLVRPVDLGLEAGLLDLRVADRGGDLGGGVLLLRHGRPIGDGPGDAGLLLDLGLVRERRGSRCSCSGS